METPQPGTCLPPHPCGEKGSGPVQETVGGWIMALLGWPRAGSRKGRAVCLSCREECCGDHHWQGGHACFVPKQHHFASQLLFQNDFSKWNPNGWKQSTGLWGPWRAEFKSILGSISFASSGAFTPLLRRAQRESRHTELLVCRCMRGSVQEMSCCLCSWVLGCKNCLMKVLHKEKEITPRKSVPKSMSNRRCNCDK